MKGDLVRRRDGSELVMTMMTWGVLSLLLTRFYLKVMHNPMVAFGQWHIAHMLWGGLFMMLAMLLIFAFEGAHVRKTGAAIFGIGWGLFIDEIGKFLTKNNDYWFRPAIIFIYISFVGLFLFYKFLERQVKIDDRTLFYSILRQLEEISENDLETGEKHKLVDSLKQLAKSKSKNLRLMASGILRSVVQINPRSNKKRHAMAVMATNVSSYSYNKFFKRKMVMYGLWAYSIYFAVDKLFDIFRIFTSSQKMAMIQKYYEDYEFFGKSDVYMIVFKLVFDLLAAIFFLIGARYFWSKKRLRGIRFFKYGLYVSIFLVSIFRFYFEQFGAIYELVISVILLELLNQFKKEVVAK